MAIKIWIENPKGGGEASDHLVENLAGLELRVAGVAERPYLRDTEILQNYESYLYDDRFFILVDKVELMQALASRSLKAAIEVQMKFQRYDYFPLSMSFCRIITHEYPENLH